MAARVLIVEDNPVARGFLGRVVRESFSDAMEITECSDLDSARRQMADTDSAGDFKLILVDIELPDEHGMELLHDLAGYRCIKIVTTLHSDDDHLFPALQCGADGYLLKEDRFEVLVEELQKIVRGHPPLSPAIARRVLSHFREGSHGTAPDPSEALTPRESEVLTYLSKGFTIKEIASLMGIQWLAVNDHIQALYRKLNASSRVEAVLAGRHALD